MNRSVSEVIVIVIVIVVVIVIVAAFAVPLFMNEASVGNADPVSVSGEGRQINGPTAAELSASWDLALANFDSRMDLRLARQELISEAGLETGKAGFHVIQPDYPGRAVDPFDTDDGDGYLRGDIGQNYYAIPDALGRTWTGVSGQSYPLVQSVSYSPLFQNSVITSAAVGADPNNPGQHTLVLAFGTEGVEILAAAMKTQVGVTTVPICASTVIDWAGHVREPGDMLTRMDVVLVADTEAYLVWPVSDVVEGNQVGLPIVAADNLSLAKASDLLSRLGL